MKSLNFLLRNFQKVRFGKTEYETLKKFERIHHPDIWSWIVEKVNGTESMGKKLKILDISDEASIFSLLLAERYPNNEITFAIKGDMPKINLPSNANVLKIGDFQDLNSAGKFDVILIKEVTKELPELGDLLIYLKNLFLNEESMVILMARPKNPPLPLPDCCNQLWMKIALSREEILAAANKAQLFCTSYSASVPIKVEKFDWESILFSGCFPVVKSSPKCTAKEITEFCKSQSSMISFEEKISLFLLKQTENN